MANGFTRSSSVKMREEKEAQAKNRWSKRFGDKEFLSTYPTVYQKNATKLEKTKFSLAPQLLGVPNNKVKSTRYSIFTFLPLTLFIQFRKVINLFYIFNGILQSFPEISTNSPLASFIPVSFVIIVGILKEAYLEYKRYVDDKKTNQTPVSILDDIADGKLVF